MLPCALNALAGGAPQHAMTSSEAASGGTRTPDRLFVRVGPQMRQLTSLDAQFLAIENGRNLGHVSGLSVYDPSTAPDGVLTADRMCAVLTERLHLLPPFRWRLAEVPLGLDHPYWVEDPDFDIEYHVRELA